MDVLGLDLRESGIIAIYTSRPKRKLTEPKERAMCTICMAVQTVQQYVTTVQIHINQVYSVRYDQFHSYIHTQTHTYIYMYMVYRANLQVN